MSNKETILIVEVRYNCKITGKGLVGYYIDLKSNISEAKWSGYTDAETLSWVADRGENIGISLIRDTVEDIELTQKGDEWKLPEDKEDINVFDIDMAFIKGVLVALKKPIAKAGVQEVEDVVEMPLDEEIKRMEDVVDTKKTIKKKVVKEDEDAWFKAESLTDDLPIFDTTVDIAAFLQYVNTEIASHNFEFNALKIDTVPDNLRIGTYYVCNNRNVSYEDTSLTVQYNKRHRLHIVVCTLSKSKDVIDKDTISFIGFLKDGILQKGYYVPLSGVQYKDVTSMAFLKHSKYKVMHKEIATTNFENLSCYEFYHVVWLGDEGKHNGYMRYYFNVKDLSFILRLNTFGGFYKYSKEIG